MTEQYTPEHERKHDKPGDNAEIESQHCGQELYGSHPRQPAVKRPRKVEEQQRNQCKKHYGKR